MYGSSRDVKDHPDSMGYVSICMALYMVHRPLTLALRSPASRHYGKSLQKLGISLGPDPLIS